MTQTGNAAIAQHVGTEPIESKLTIGKAAVLGAGTMGAGIAAHLANSGIPVLLLDIAPTELTDAEITKELTLESPAVRNRWVDSLFDAAKKVEPAPVMLGDNAELITTGNFTDDLAKIRIAIL